MGRAAGQAPRLQKMRAHSRAAADRQARAWRRCLAWLMTWRRVAGGG